MKLKNLAFLVAAVGSLFTVINSTHAQGTAFTYQGLLNANGGPVNGSYDLTFALFDAGTSGNLISHPLTNSAVAVSNGLFTVALDFGTNFPGQDRWLQIGVRANGNGAFSPLSPLQHISPAPYAITAENLAAVARFNTVVPGQYATVAGGEQNSATNLNTTVAGGGGNASNGEGSTVGGGEGNRSSGLDSTVGGGYINVASQNFATIAGGYGNLANGYDATVPGGQGNQADGNDSFAAGFNAHALYNGDFVWADESGSTFSSTAFNQFAVRAAGGVLLAANVQIGTGNGDYRYLEMGGGNASGFLYGSYPAWGDGISLGYNWYADANGNGHTVNPAGQTSRVTVGYESIVLAVGGIATMPGANRLVANGAGVSVYGTFNNNSDRNAKQDFTPVSPAQILDKVLQLPVSQWSYKVDAATRHVGPMAQDFYSAFNIGTDDKHIAPIDEGGVALAAIQGLNQKLDEKDADIQQLKQQNDSLVSRLNELEQLVQTLATKKY